MPKIIKNASAGGWRPDERMEIAAFRARTIDFVKEGGALMALFGLPEPDGVCLCSILGKRQSGALRVLVSSAVAGDGYPALTPLCPQAHMFERELAEIWDILPQGHPWLKPVRFAAPRRKGADVFGFAGKGKIAPAAWDCFKVEGEEVHEVAVGPVHAGIIEPGHFRFQCHGENVFQLEILLGFQHRGVEEAIAANPRRRLYLAETAAGDTTIGHALAYCRIAEALSGCQPGGTAETVRAVALELERLANHTGDLGALAGDIGYLPTMSFCGRLRGDFLNMTALLCGSRFGRGLLREGGVKNAVSAETARELLKRLDAAERDVENAASLLASTPSVLARFEGTGAVSAQTARQLGLAGPAARACGLDVDARRDFASGFYRARRPETALRHAGDVAARAEMRRLEIKNSINFIKELLPAAAGAAPAAQAAKFQPSAFAVAVEEGWRGEIIHFARTDSAGEIDFYKIVDPSFKNWPGLAAAMRGQQISDFPLCNKSFNLSYCGHDL